MAFVFLKKTYNHPNNSNQNKYCDWKINYWRHPYCFLRIIHHIDQVGSTYEYRKFIGSCQPAGK